MRWLVVGPAGLPALRALRAIGELELACVLPRAHRDEGRFVCGKRNTVESWDDAPAYDTVILASDPGDRVADITRATGANIIVQPPLALTLADRAAIDAAIKRERVGMMSLPLRFHPGMGVMANLHKNGHFGDVYLAKAQAGHPVDRYAGRRRAQVGGLVYDHADLLDVLTWAFGPPTSLRASAHGALDGSDLEAAVHGVLQFPATLATLELVVLQPGLPYRMGLQFVGKGADRPPFVIPALAPDGTSHLEADAAGWDTAYQAQARHWREAIAGTADPQTPFVVGWQTVELAQAVYASAEAGMGVTFKRPEAA